MAGKILTILSNEAIADRTYKMVLRGEGIPATLPGQFINILLPDFFLRRPMSIASRDEETLNIYYRTVGNGTRRMSQLAAGEKLDVLVGLGNGFSLHPTEGKRILLIGGGLGTAPLIGLAQVLKEQGRVFDAVIGFGEQKAVFGYNELRNCAANLTVTTIDGSNGTKGLVTDVIDAQKYSYYFACGPEKMLRAVHRLSIEGQLSFEARMGCGFGACMGCSCRTLAGTKRICLEGPVMKSTEIYF